MAAHTHAVTLIFPTDFRAKERLLAVYKVDRDVTRRKAQAQMISNFSEVWSTLQFVTWPTVLFPGPPRDIVYLCTARSTLTALRTEDIWPFFCFSCPFMSFEAQRKSKYAKLLQFSVANFQLWGPCRHFLIEWPLFVAISFGRCHYFLAHVACRNLPWKSLIRAEESSPLVHKDVCYLKLQIVTYYTSVFLYGSKFSWSWKVIHYCSQAYR